MNYPVIGAGLITLAAILLIKRGADVRLILILAGLVISSLASQPWAVFDAFQKAVGRGDIIGPICSAMGFAFVVKKTGCDQDMVRLLMRPLRKLQWALIPGGAAIGFVTNMAITSQTAAAAAVGPILVPLLIAAGHSRLAAAATLLVGCSVGGNLFNPGEPDVVAVHVNAGADIGHVLGSVFVPNIISFVVGVAVLSVLLYKKHDHGSTAAQAAVNEVIERPVSIGRAILVPLPVLILLLLQPSLMLAPDLFRIYPNGLHVSTVMLACSFLVMAVTSMYGDKADRTHFSVLTASFFEGMGFGFAKVISLIIAASCFIAGLEAVGAIATLTGIFRENLALAGIMSPILTFGLAVVSGSGTAPSVAFSQAMLPGLAITDKAQAVMLGSFGAIGASIGRTMSPVSAIVLFTGTLAEVDSAALIKLATWPMLASLVSVILYGMLF